MDAYDELLAMLDRPAADHWDRPHGDWGTTDHGGEAALTEARQAANSGYRLGSKALRRGDVSRAVEWFALGTEEQHPGAAFRWAAAEARRGFVVHHAAGSGKSTALVLMVRLMARASSWGHGDAERLVNRIRWHEDGATETPDGAGCSPRARGWTGADSDADRGEPSPPRARGWDPGHTLELRVFDLLPARAGVGRFEPVGDPCDGLVPARAGVDPLPTPDSSPHEVAPRAHEATLLQWDVKGGTVCESILDSELRDRLTLAPDEEPYSPQDPEFYPEVREAFERLFAGSRNRRGLAAEVGDEYTAVEEDAAPRQPAAVRVGDAPVAALTDTTGMDGSGREAAIAQPRAFPRRATLWTPGPVLRGGHHGALETWEEYERLRTLAYYREGGSLVDPMRLWLATMMRMRARRDLVNGCAYSFTLIRSYAWYKTPWVVNGELTASAHAWRSGACGLAEFTQVVPRLLRTVGFEAHPVMPTTGHSIPPEVWGKSVDLNPPERLLHELLSEAPLAHLRRPALSAWKALIRASSLLHAPSPGCSCLDELLKHLLEEAAKECAPDLQSNMTVSQSLRTDSIRRWLAWLELKKLVSGDIATSEKSGQHRPSVTVFEAMNAVRDLAVSA